MVSMTVYRVFLDHSEVEL